MISVASTLRVYTLAHWLRLMLINLSAHCVSSDHGPRVGWGGGRAPALVSGWPSWPLAVRYWARAPVYTMAPASGLYITSVHGARGTL